MKTENSKNGKTMFSELTVSIYLFTAVMLLGIQANATNKIINAEFKASTELLALESEETINLENWMLNESNFIHSNVFESDEEFSLELENWMTNGSLFTATANLHAEVEKALEINSWMMDESLFAPAVFIETENDKTLELDAWMMDKNFFYYAYALDNDIENENEVESWMLNDTIFEIASTEEPNTESLALSSEKNNEKYTTIEYKDSITGRTFLFKLAEAEESELVLEKWMVDPKHWNIKK